MAAPIAETIWLVNDFKSHIVMGAPSAVIAPSSVQNLMKSSSRRFDGKSRVLMIETNENRKNLSKRAHLNSLDFEKRTSLDHPDLSSLDTTTNVWTNC